VEGVVLLNVVMFLTHKTTSILYRHD